MAVWLFQVAFDYYLVNVLYSAVCVVYTARKNQHVCKFGADPFFRPVLVTVVVLTCLVIYIFLYFLILDYCTNYNILIKIKIVRRIMTMIMIIIILLSLETDKKYKSLHCMEKYIIFYKISVLR